MKKQSKQRIALSIVVVSLWFIFFSYMCVVMGIAKLFVSPELKDFFIQITSSLGGGFCTLLSVILAARYAKERDNENDIKNNIPDIFLPLNCDYSHVVYCSLVSTKPSKVRTRKEIIIKNTTKAAFKILELSVNENIFKPVSGSFIEKGQTFSLLFKYKPAIAQAVLKIESMDNIEYTIKIIYKNNKIFDIKKASLCV